MKVVVIDDATEEEVKRILDMVGVGRHEKLRLNGQIEDGQIGKRVPRNVPKGLKKKAHYTSPHTAKIYTNDELKKIRAFYLDSNNHYVNGDIVGSKLSRFARSIERTPMALSVKLIGMRLNRRLVRGRHRQRRGEKDRTSMLRSHPVVPRGFDRERIALANKSKPKSKPKRRNAKKIFNPYRFPKFESVQNQELVHSMLSSLIRGTINAIRESDAVALGINDWDEFLQEVLIESKSICAYLRRPNNLKVEMSNGGKVLGYSH